MKTPVALVIALVASMGIVAAIVGPCDGPTDTTQTPRAKQPGPPDAIAVATKPRVRTNEQKSDTAEEFDPSHDDVERFALRMRVTDERTHAPVAGAEISIYLGAFTTNADGEATIGGLSRGSYDTEIRARGFVHKSCKPWVPCDDAPEVFELAAGVVVPVEVVDTASGRPVPGATVTLRPGDELIQEDVVVTDEAGRAEAYLPQGVAVTATTRALGHVDALDFVRTAALDAPQPTLRVLLAPGAMLRGVVRDPDGTPVAGARVYVCRTDADGEIESRETGADGAYEVDGLTAGVNLLAHAGLVGGPPDWCASAEVPVTLAGEGGVVDLRLRKCGSLEYAIVDDDGQPVDRVTIKLASDSSGSKSSAFGVAATTVTETMTPGRWVLKVWSEDRIPVAETFDIAEGETTKRTVVLSEGATVEGVVVDELDEPVEGAGIEDAAPSIDETAPSFWCRSDENGHFALRHLAKGVHDLVVDPPYEFERVVVSGVMAPSEGGRFVVMRRGTLALHVVFEDDARPAAQYPRIAFSGEQDGKPWHIDRSFPADGRFEVAWPAGVRGEVGIAVDGFLPVTGAVTVPAGAAVDLGEVRLRRGFPLSGVLRAAEGGPLSVSGCTLVVRGVWNGGRCKTDENSRFAFDGLPPGKVRIDLEGFAGTSLVDVPSREPVVLKLPRTGLLTVVLVDSTGAPVAGRRLVVRDADGASIADDATDVNGAWSRRLAPGPYSVDVDHGPHADVEVRQDDATFVKLR